MCSIPYCRANRGGGPFGVRRPRESRVGAKEFKVERCLRSVAHPAPKHKPSDVLIKWDLFSGELR